MKALIRKTFVVLAAITGGLAALGAYGQPAVEEKVTACPDKRCDGQECTEFLFGKQCFVIPPACETADCEF